MASEVGGNAGWAGDVTIHPMPPDLRARGIGRREKTGFERIRGGGARQSDGSSEDENSEEA